LQQKSARVSSLNIAFYAKAKSIQSRKAFWLTALWLITVAQQLVNFTRFPSFSQQMADNLGVRTSKVDNKSTFAAVKKTFSNLKCLATIKRLIEIEEG